MFRVRKLYSRFCDPALHREALDEVLKISRHPHILIRDNLRPILPRVEGVLGPRAAVETIKHTLETNLGARSASSPRPTSSVAKWSFAAPEFPWTTLPHSFARSPRKRLQKTFPP